MNRVAAKNGNRRVVSVWFPCFATDRLARNHRHARWRDQSHKMAEHEKQRQQQGKTGATSKNSLVGAAPDAYGATAEAVYPFATVHLVRGGHRLAAVNNAATRVGLFPGLPLADARARVPNLEAAPSDPDGDRRALEKLAFWAGRYTPWTAVDDSAAKQLGAAPTTCGLWLDISGCAHLFGGEEALLTDLTDRLTAAGYTRRVGVADTPGAAWAVARFGASPHHTVAGKAFHIVPSGAQRAALASLPVQGLRLDTDTAEALTRLGLCHIGDLYPLARADLARRFGVALAMRLDQALGDRDEPLSPLQPPPVRQVRLKFPEPIGLIDDIQAALDRLLPALSERLARAGEGARRLDFTLYRVDGTAVTARVGTSRPERSPEHLRRLFREKLADLDPGFGVETVLLAARAVEPLAAIQEDLGAEGSERSAAPASVLESHELHQEDDGLGRLIDRLANRLGPGRVVGLSTRASHLPERAERSYPLAQTSPKSSVTAGKGAFLESSHEGSHAPTAPRPVYLLPVPEPVDVLSPGPDEPPVLMRWRGRQHGLVRAEGPERIAPEWWRDLILSQQGDDQENENNRGQAPEIRDYYCVEDEAGARFWLYRQNKLSMAAVFGSPVSTPKWYLHGLFP